MAKSNDETSPTEPIEPVETPVAEQPPVAAEPAPHEAAPAQPVAEYATPPAAPVHHLRSTENRVVLVISLVLVAFVVVTGVFAAGVAVGRHTGPGGRFGASRPGMMQGYGRGFDDQGGGYANPGQGYGGQGQYHRRGGRGMMPGQGQGQGYGGGYGYGGQNSLPPTGSVPAVPGQY
jgi:hypothetical protein